VRTEKVLDGGDEVLDLLLRKKERWGALVVNVVESDAQFDLVTAILGGDNDSGAWPKGEGRHRAEVGKDGDVVRKPFVTPKRIEDLVGPFAKVGDDTEE
jgi:hypothetical protein